MDLSSVAVAIRPRRPWEAVDLGIRMGRRWWSPMVRVWLILTLPLLVVLHLVPRDYLWVPPLVLWWTKPLWERALLYILSQALFGHLPSTRETLSAFPALAKRQIIPWLTWRRLTPYRSMDMPVTQLEGLSGQRRSERVQLLRRQDARPAGWLTIIGIHLESFFGIAMVLLVWALIPESVEIDVDLSVLMEPPVTLLVVQNLLAYLAAVVVAPFYVAAGFALYLNRRIHLEGWDLQVAFNQIVQKRQTPERKPRAAAGPLAAVLLAVLVLTGMDGAKPAVAAEAALTPERAREQIAEILEGDSFHQKKTLKRIVGQDDADVEAVDPSFFEGLSSFGRALAAVLEVLFWLLVIALIVVVALKYRSWLEEFATRRGGRVRVPRPETLFGLDVRPESLPEDVPATARRLWWEDPRAALALLYRASLTQLMARGLEIAPGDTEGDCVRLTRQMAPEVTASYFARLTRHWQQLAWAHHLPEQGALEQLCADWDSAWSREEGRG